MICQNSSFHKHPNFYNCCNVPVSATIVFTLKNKNKNNTRKFKILWLKLRELFLTVVFTKTPNVTVVFRLLSKTKNCFWNIITYRQKQPPFSQMHQLLPVQFYTLSIIKNMF